MGENMRVLKWVVDRVRGRAYGREMPIGWMPRYEDLEWNGMEFARERFQKLQAIDRSAWRREIAQHEELFIDLHDHLPPEILYERELLIGRLSRELSRPMRDDRPEPVWWVDPDGE